MSGVAKLFNDNVLNKSDEKVDFNDDKYDGTVFGLYFSAHWCPPCRRFTPILIDFYNKYSKEKNFEIIFISSDEDQNSFDEYYKDMPWLKLNQQDQDNKDKLDELFQVNGIPTLILLDGHSADVICKDARKKIQNDDKTGQHFPWKQQPKDDEDKDKDEDD